MLHLTLYLMFKICKYILIKGLGVSLLFLFLFFSGQNLSFPHVLLFLFFSTLSLLFHPSEKSIGIQSLDNRYTPLKYIPSTFTTFTQLLLLVLPCPHSASTTAEFLERNGWEKRGIFGHNPTPHYHPNTHECYGGVPTANSSLRGKPC
ncbi:hypothetical protein I7I48_10854 [Histoplasma ohiense]|nr:hypothetical protein I7I48_10854 [Histoplasma ohiense (nom. inval.)]